MKTIVALFLACFATSLFGQPFPPIIRNEFTTNTPPAAKNIVTNIVNALAGTNRFQMLSPAAGNSGELDWIGKSATVVPSIGVAWYGDLRPFFYFATRTNVNDWTNAPAFPTGVSQFGSTYGMDPSINSMNFYFNGHTNGWNRPGDGFINSRNLSTNQSSSGSGYTISVMGVNPASPFAELLDENAAAFLHVPTNRNAGLIPGWSQLVFNSFTLAGGSNNMRGLAVSSPYASEIDIGNYSMAMFDWNNDMFRIPFWVASAYQPRDTGWRDTLTALPKTGRVGVGTDTPGALLDVTNRVGSTGTPIFHAGTNAVNGLTVSSNGNVGIGTATPTNTLDVAGTASIQGNLLVTGGQTNVGLLRVGGSIAVAGGTLPVGNGLYSTASTLLGLVSGSSEVAAVQNGAGIIIQTNGSWWWSSTSTGAGNTGVGRDTRIYRVSAGIVGLTNLLVHGYIEQNFSVAAPSAPSTQGALYWNDGTNTCVVLRNGAGTLTTNKLSMAAWP